MTGIALQACFDSLLVKFIPAGTIVGLWYLAAGPPMDLYAF
jgi:hypothetical protein